MKTLFHCGLGSKNEAGLTYSICESNEGECFVYLGRNRVSEAQPNLIIALRYILEHMGIYKDLNHKKEEKKEIYKF